MVPTTRAYPRLKHILWAQLPQGGPERKTEMLFEDISSTATRDTVSIMEKGTMARLAGDWSQPPHFECKHGGTVGQFMPLYMVIKPCP